jgi:hypothetical protein
MQWKSWELFVKHAGVPSALKNVLLLEPQPEVRETVRKLIDEKVSERENET